MTDVRAEYVLRDDGKIDVINSGCIDDDYTIALVGSSNDSHLWILSRSPRTFQETINKYVAEARHRGYDTIRLIKGAAKPSSLIIDKGNEKRVNPIGHPLFIIRISCCYLEILMLSRKKRPAPLTL